MFIVTPIQFFIPTEPQLLIDTPIQFFIPTGPQFVHRYANTDSAQYRQYSSHNIDTPDGIAVSI